MLTFHQRIVHQINFKTDPKKKACDEDLPTVSQGLAFVALAALISSCLLGF